MFFIGNRYIEVAPEDVIWSNLGMNPYEQKVQLSILFVFCVSSLALRCGVDVRIVYPLVPLIIFFHVTFKLTTFFTDTYRYQLFDNRCLDHFLGIPRYVLSYQSSLIFVTIPSSIVTFVGIVSNIFTVCKSAAFLAWICKLPPPVVGIISVCLLYSRISTFAGRFLISGLFIGRFTACAFGSAYDVAPYRPPSFGAL